MNILIGDDDVGVKKSSKKMKNDRPPREGREVTERYRE